MGTVLPLFRKLEWLLLPGSYKNRAVHQWLCERTSVTRGMPSIITVIISDEEAYWGRYGKNFKWPNYLYCTLQRPRSPFQTVELYIGYFKRLSSNVHYFILLGLVDFYVCAWICMYTLFMFLVLLDAKRGSVPQDWKCSMVGTGN